MNFDEDRWYHVYIGEDKTSALVGTYLVFGDPLLQDTTKQNNTVGATFKSVNNIEEKNNVEQKWQIVAFDSDYYVLRTQAAGVNGYLSSYFDADRTNLSSRTLTRMVRDNVSDASVYWKITPWRDGTFQLTNKANGTDLLFEIGGEHDDEDGTETRMSSNFTNIPRRQFSFEVVEEANGVDIGKIDNEAWSRAAISLPATTSSSTTATSTTATSTTATSTGSNAPNAPTSSSSVAPTSESSSGLSTGAKAGIGAGVGVVALIALVVLGLFLFRRRKRRATPPTDEHWNPYSEQGYSDAAGQGATVKYGHTGIAERPELDSSAHRAELSHLNQEPAELAGAEMPRQELKGDHDVQQANVPRAT